MPLNRLAACNLRYTQIALEHRDRSAPFRTFLDSFFAHSKGGAYLNGKGKPHWFNTPDPRRHREALLGLHFVSIKAARVVAGFSNEPLVRDHAVPIAVIRDILMNAALSRLDIIDGYVRKYYRLGLLTISEDKRLNEYKLRSSMPPGWTANDDVYARYRTAGIASQTFRDTF